MREIDFEDDQIIWKILKEHIEEAKELQRMVVSSVDENCRPQVRTMILRAVEHKTKCLYFYTDARSPKIGQWQKNQFCQVLAYSSSELLQLRFTAKAVVWQSGELYQSAKSGLKEHQWRDYSSLLAPGSDYDPALKSSSDKLNFALVQIKVEQMEILKLLPKAQEHLRYSFNYEKKNELARRLVP